MRLWTPIVVVAVAFSSAAFADDAPAMNTSVIRGTVQSFDGKTLAVKTSAGPVVSLPVGGSTRFATVVNRTFAQLKPNNFVGVTAVPGDNGHLRAEEIHTLPLHGLNEGEYPWDHHPSTVTNPIAASSMTNGTLIRTKEAAAGMMMAPSSAAPASNMTGTVTSTAGMSQMLVTYHGAAMVGGKCQGMVSGHAGCTGTVVIDVPPNTPVQAIVPSFHPEVKPGMTVAAAVETDSAGHKILTSATLENNGVKPEF